MWEVTVVVFICAKHCLRRRSLIFQGFWFRKRPCRCARSGLLKTSSAFMVYHVSPSVYLFRAFKVPVRGPVAGIRDLDMGYQLCTWALRGLDMGTQGLYIPIRGSVAGLKASEVHLALSETKQGDPQARISSSEAWVLKCATFLNHGTTEGMNLSRNPTRLRAHYLRDRPVRNCAALTKAFLPWLLPRLERRNVLLEMGPAVDTALNSF